MREWTREERYRVLKNPQELWELYLKTKDSKYRQIFHIQSVTGLINDPNGFCFFDNKWHLFYQWCPWGAVHGLKYWYHIVSEDLVSWTNLGVTLLPEESYGYDNKGVYSGSAFPADDKLYLFYTGNNRDENYIRHPYNCLARMEKDGFVTKYPLPLWAEHPDYTEHQRDPKIIAFPQENRYYMVLGAQTKDKKGCVLVYKSEDLLHGWNFAGQLTVPGYEDFGNMWECPSIEHIGDKDVLLFCPQNFKLPGRGETMHHNVYIVGQMNWENLVFTPDDDYHVLDFGFDSYAAAFANNTVYGDKSILIAWMGLPDASYPTDEEDWSGCLSLPRELTMQGVKLIQRPLPELIKLRNEKVEITTNESGCIHLPEAAEIEITAGEDFCLGLFTDVAGEGGIVISYDDAIKEISVDRSGMKNRFNEDQGEVRKMKLTGLRALKIYIDHSSIEIFVNDGEAVFTSRSFPSEDEHYIHFKNTENFVSMWTLKSGVDEKFVI